MTAAPTVRSGTASACGSCGELVQGVLPDGQAFQVTMPMDVFSSAHVVARQREDWVALSHPRDRTKAAAAALATAQHLGSPPLHLTVTIDSTIPIGAGLGSSTADVVATVRATATALAAVLTPNEIGSIAGAIEPTDGTMHRGMCVTDRRGRLLEAWPWTPTFHVVVLVPEGRGVATEAVALDRQREWASAYAELLDGLRVAAHLRDPRPFIEAAATSAALHQEVLANDLLARAPALARDTGAAGWNIAHTGTALGLLFAEPDRATTVATTLPSRPGLAGVRAFRATTLTGRSDPTCR